MVDRPPFVDAHVHLWDLGRIRYPWLAPPFSDDGPNGSVEPIAVDYGIDEYLADAGNWEVRGCVHVEAGADADQALDETFWLQAIADDRGMPNAIVAFAALNDPEVDRLLAQHAARRNVRGIRQIVNWHPDARRTYTPRDFTRDEQWHAGFSLLGKYRLSFDLQAYPDQFPALASLFERHPDIPIIVNHNGMAVGEAGLEAWRAGMRAIAGISHVSVKISGLGFAFRPWTIAQARPYVLETIDLFGVDRCMFASDFPTDKLFGSFDKHLDAYSEITRDFVPEERSKLFAGNAERIYRIDRRGADVVDRNHRRAPGGMV